MARQTTEAVSICIPDGIHVFYLTRIENLAHRLFALQPTRHFAYCTAGGRAMMSRMPEADVKQVLAHSPMRRLTGRTVIDPDEISRLLELYRAEEIAWQDGEVHDDDDRVSEALHDCASAV